MSSKDCPSPSLEDSKVEVAPGRIPDTPLFKCSTFQGDKCPPPPKCGGEQPRPIDEAKCPCQKQMVEPEPPAKDDCAKPACPPEEPRACCPPITPLVQIYCNCPKPIAPIPVVKKSCGSKAKNCCPNTSCETKPLTMEQK